LFGLTAALIDDHYDSDNDHHSYTDNDTHRVPGGRTTHSPVTLGLTATETTVLGITTNIAVYRRHRTWIGTGDPFYLRVNLIL